MTDERIENSRFYDEAKEIIDNGNYDAAVNLMDDDIREELHRELAPCTDIEFLVAYFEAHYERFGDVFEI